MHVSASILSCDLLNLETEIENLEKAGIDSLHVDIMDGHFVPNISFGVDMVKQLRLISNLPINVHLMVDNPKQFIDSISHCNVECLIIHSEIKQNIENTLKNIKRHGMDVGLAISPQTQIVEVMQYLPLVDFALIMGVPPGFGGQKLIEPVLSKIGEIRSIHHKITIGLDGGVNENTIALIKAAKPDTLVVGNYLLASFQKKNRLDDIKEKLKILCQRK
ncbi:MAG: ribulose-phosphate 3-epimerase [Holosporales bacterium]|jgi:ribulose-phosphate 3-epimerase|nr:ribulose-phosphate 3-epimerase [Holosporales bacterium]